jgi:hypothetical protein
MSVTSGVLCTTPLACLRLAQLSPPQWSIRDLHDHNDLRSLFEKKNLASIHTQPCFQYSKGHQSYDNLTLQSYWYMNAYQYDLENNHAVPRTFLRRALWERSSPSLQEDGQTVASRNAHASEPANCSVFSVSASGVPVNKMRHDLT